MKYEWTTTNFDSGKIVLCDRQTSHTMRFPYHLNQFIRVCDNCFNRSIINGYHEVDDNEAVCTEVLES